MWSEVGAVRKRGQTPRTPNAWRKSPLSSPLAVCEQVRLLTRITGNGRGLAASAGLPGLPFFLHFLASRIRTAAHANADTRSKDRGLRSAAGKKGSVRAGPQLDMPVDGPDHSCFIYR